MSAGDWADSDRQAFGMQIGNDLPQADRLLILVNAAEEPCDFTLAPIIGGPWTAIFDTTRQTGAVPAGQALFPPGAGLRLDPQAIYVLRARPASAYRG
jgi:glycogen operon protein